jgi:tetratricopeptide (TPR) repeat protein
MLGAQIERRTGAFTVRVEQVQTRVYVAAGSVVFVEQGTLSDTLGRVLVREGKLTSDQYEVALKRMMRGQPGSQPMRFGEALVALGFLSGEEVFEALGSQVRQKTIRCLAYPEPEWSFEEHAHTEGHFPSRAGRLILTAAGMFAPERIRVILDLEHARYPRLVSDAASAGLLFEMNATEQGILNLVDGANSTQDLIALAEKTSNRNDVWAVLAAVVQTGVAELSVEPYRLPAAIRHAAPAKQEPPSNEGSRPRLPVAEPSPGGAGHVAIGVIALKKSVQAASTKVPASVDGAASARLDPRSARLAGEEAFQKGRRLLDRGQAGHALAELDRALALCPEAAEFRLAREWAEFLANANEETRSAKLSALKQTAGKAIKLDPSFAFAFFVLGRVASLEGLDRPAIRFFRQAVNLDSSMVEAERYLRVLTLRASRPESSPELTATRKPISSSHLSAARKPIPPTEGPQHDGTLGEKATGIERLGLMINDVVAEVQPQKPEGAPTQQVAPAQDAPSAREARHQQAPAVHGPSSHEAGSKPARSVGTVLILSIAGVVLASLVAWQMRSRHPLAVRVGVTSAPRPEPHGQPSTTPDPSSVARTSPAPSPSASVSPKASVPLGAPLAVTDSVAIHATGPAIQSTPSATSLLGPTQGTLKTSLTSAGHRLFVDGRVIGETPNPVLVSCGAHVIKIGGAGREQLIYVPCGGTAIVQP